MCPLLVLIVPGPALTPLGDRLLSFLCLCVFPSVSKLSFVVLVIASFSTLVIHSSELRMFSTPQHVRSTTRLALVQSTISHPRVSVELIKLLCFSTFDTRLHRFGPQNGIESSSSGGVSVCDPPRYLSLSTASDRSPSPRPPRNCTRS